MLTWETINRLVAAGTGSVNPMLIGLVIEDLDEEIKSIQSRREDRQLSTREDELLREFVLKRYLLMKKLRDYFRVRDYNDDLITEQEVIDNVEPASKRDMVNCQPRNGMKECSQDQRLSDESKKVVS